MAEAWLGTLAVERLVHYSCWTVASKSTSAKGNGQISRSLEILRRVSVPDVARIHIGWLKDEGALKTFSRVTSPFVKQRVGSLLRLSRTTRWDISYAVLHTADTGHV